MNQQKLKTSKVEFDLSNNTYIENFDNTNNSFYNVNDTTIIRNRTKYIPFWAENPNILFNQKYIFEFFPVDNMTYEQKLNAVTRTIVLLTLFGFLVSYNLRLLLVSAITIGAIFLLHYYHKKENEKNESKKLSNEIKESFENPALAYLKENNIPIPDDVFDETNSSNPFGNVLMTDYEYNPNKKPAPPAFNKNVNDTILKQAKQLVSEANPDQPDIADKLFKDLGEQLVFEQSLRPFNSNPSTTIPNDQAAFADFCYGSMISCKEGNKFACARNLSRHTN
jgi:hypothetical protein